MTKSPKQSSIGVLQDAGAPLPRRSRNAPRPDKPPPLDMMPTRIDPCLATLVAKPPKGRDWAFEVKWDGYRVAVHIEKGGVRILTRGGHDWTDRFPSIAAEAPHLPLKTAILDGEAVVLDEQGRSDFGLLQRALGTDRRRTNPAKSSFTLSTCSISTAAICAACRSANAGGCSNRCWKAASARSVYPRRWKPMGKLSSASPASSALKV